MNSILKTLEMVQVLAKIAFYTSVVYVTVIATAFFLKNIY